MEEIEIILYIHALVDRKRVGLSCTCMCSWLMELNDGGTYSNVTFQEAL